MSTTSNTSNTSNTTSIYEFIAANGPCATSDLKKRFGRDRTKPRQYDVMRAPPWVPPSMTTPRPGADSHSAFKSHGHRC